MITFSSYAMQVVVGFAMMVAILIILPRALVSAKRINQVLALEPSVAFPSESKNNRPRGYRAEFQDVSFRYGRTPCAVIEHVTFCQLRKDKPLPSSDQPVLGKSNFGQLDSALLRCNRRKDL